jgi:TRAP-type C4-dicarboxylate transport system substrate-binding protein
MKKCVICIGLLFFCLGLFVGVSHAAEKVITLAFSSFLPSNNPLGLVYQQWCKDVEERTNGRVKVNFYPASTLTPAPQTYDSVIRGIADVGQGAMGYTQGRFPLSEVLDLPLGLKNAEIATKLGNAFYNKFKPKELDEVKFLAFATTGPGLIHTKKPVRKLEDLAGLKIRQSGGMGVKVLKELGAVPVVIPMGDTYDALQKGTIEGIAIVPDAIESWKLYEVLDYTTMNYRTSVAPSGYIVMNKNKWNSLPPDIQKIIEKVSEETSARWAEVFDKQDEIAFKAFAGRKHTVITLNEEEEKRWYQRVAPLLDAYVKEKSAKGLPAAEALKFCQDWIKVNQK